MASEQGQGAVTLGNGDRAAATAAVKALLRITSVEEDALIGDMVEAALEVAEKFIGQVTIVRTVTLNLPAGAGWQRLPAAPVSAIVTVAGRDAGGATIPLVGDAYAIDIDADGDGWVRLTQPSAVAGLTATVSAGLAADWGALPGPLRQGVAMLAAYLYDKRDGAGNPPAAVTALWRPLRRMRLDARVPA